MGVCDFAHSFLVIRTDYSICFTITSIRSLERSTCNSCVVLIDTTSHFHHSVIDVDAGDIDIVISGFGSIFIYTYIYIYREVLLNAQIIAEVAAVVVAAVAMLVVIGVLVTSVVSIVVYEP